MYVLDSTATSIYGISDDLRCTHVSTAKTLERGAGRICLAWPARTNMKTVEGSFVRYHVVS